jgi:ribosomal protein L33
MKTKFCTKCKIEKFITEFNKRNNKDKLQCYCRDCNKLYCQEHKVEIKENKKTYYELNNIVLACGRCNFVKSNFFTEQEMLKIGNIIKTKKEVLNG